MLRARHLPYSIGTDEPDQWLECIARPWTRWALPRPQAPREGFLRHADWMRNRPG